MSEEKNTHIKRSKGSRRMKTHSFCVMDIITSIPTICRGGHGIKSVFIWVHDKWDKNNNDCLQVHSYNLHENHVDTEEY